ncbi:uncharacterized protein HMF8227_01873 [Saliniradius amylolyticus]|uniref:SUI1 domain-containing protein n=1 Tax=Saliniradius amylolyticus TaxID=2183582 RepID=A0A2S2E3Y5_9ALTE|nr:stress response translation initiation inhibitor YciH [Saliniradius amylolyticus]AWL12343.1 uncharacterized protein HMF8227_01873 [Saliniradius amylolyticus]
MSDNNLVYSTDMGRIKPEEPKSQPKSGDGIVRLRRETKGRKGKGVTIVDGLLDPDEQIKKLCKELKKQCGTGGTVKDGVIEIQGDNRNNIKAALEKKGYQVKLAGG